VSCNIGHIYVKMGQDQLAMAALNRSRSIAEQIGDRPLPAVIDYNMAALAFFAHDLVQAEILYRRALRVAEGFNDREYVSRWNVELAAVLQQQGGKEQLKEARLCVARALRIGRSMRNNPCIGSALIAIGNLYLQQAMQTSKKLPATRARLLEQAQHAIVQSLHMTGLEAETQIRGQLAHAQLTVLLGKKKQSQQEMRQVLERAHVCKLAMVERSAKEFTQK
jgi:tetratricopeptide (TPR) repeat protein